MIIYTGTSKTFQEDEYNGILVSKIENIFHQLGIFGGSYQERTSWMNSLPVMASVLNHSSVPDDAQIAIELQIPTTSKRVDFMIGGNDGNNDHIIVIELKQWEKCTATSRDEIVHTFTGGMERDVAHPSYQAYSYVKLIEDLNEDVRINHIILKPCAFLHNFQELYKNELCHPKYQEIINEAPVFLARDKAKLANYIETFIKKPSHKKLFDIVNHGKIRPSKSLQDTFASIMKGNQEFYLIDEQKVSYSTILKVIENSLKENKKSTVIVQGGPGTGKSVIAVNLLAKLNMEAKSAMYVAKTSAPKAAFSSNLVKNHFKQSYIKGLFSGSGQFVNTPSNYFDCLIVDEAHRLNEKSGIFANLGENQIKEIINACKVSVFFIDEDQIVSSKDIGTIEEISKWAKQLKSQLYIGEDLKLTSQFRCNGSDSYLAFLDDLLAIRRTANYDFFDLDYDLQIFDDPNQMKEALRKKNTNNKARMIAGYCYPWVSDKDKTLYDIYLENGFKAQWNFNTTSFAIEGDTFEQVGCIHSTQGLEFDYVGIIIGKDLRYENNTVVADPSKRDKRDITIKGLKNDKEKAIRIIKNTYKVLLSRGQKGCYIYCEDKELSKYMKERLQIIEKNKKKIGA